MRKDVGDSHGPELISGRTLLFVVNVAWFFLSHRLALARAAMAAGLRVHLAASVEDPEEILKVREAGVEFHRLELARGGTNPLRDLGSFRRLQRIMLEVRPDLVHNVTAKPIVYGTQAARESGVRGIVNAVSGFGYAYASRSRRLLRGLLDTGFERAFRPANVRIVVQNADDRAAVLRLCPSAEQRIRLIVGSGVDLREFRPSLSLMACRRFCCLPECCARRGFTSLPQRRRSCDAPGLWHASFWRAGSTRRIAGR